jgi:hypothetical protein
MKEIHVVITVARQVEGEYVFIKTEKAFFSSRKADDLLRQLKSKYATEDGKWKPQLISTANGEATCQCEVGIFSVALEDIDKEEK